MAEHKPSHRPRELTDLFFGGEPYPDWQAFNWKARRFYVLNATRVLGLLRLPHTSAGPYLEEAHELILRNTEWSDQFPGNYEASRTQLYPNKVQEPKTLDRAAVLIVALEQAARHQDADINVYEHLRVAPAYYYVDGLNGDRLRNLLTMFEALPRERKADIAHGLNAREGADFQQLAMRYIPQPASATILREIASGFCVTKNVAERIIEFVRFVFDESMGIGPIRTSGSPDSITPELGRKAAAPSMHPPHGPR